MTGMECIDHALMLGCLGGSLWATWAVLQRKEVVLAEVIYLNFLVSLAECWTSKERAGLECSTHAHWTMLMAAAMGKNGGVTVSWKKGIFSPF